MTIAPCLAGVKAAHEPSPANGCISMPSTLTFTSVRGQPMRTTPSFVVVAFAPDASPILSASSFAFGASSSDRAECIHPTPPTSTTANTAPDRGHVILFMLRSSRARKDAQGGGGHTGPSPPWVESVYLVAAGRKATRLGALPTSALPSDFSLPSLDTSTSCSVPSPMLLTS